MEKKNNYSSMLGLAPTYVDGTERGSTYKVIARTGTGYVAVRRLSKYYYRIRAERFDKNILVDLQDNATVNQLAKVGLNVTANGSRVSGSTGHRDQVINLAGVLCSILLDVENTIGELESSDDPDCVKKDEMIDAKNAGKVAEALKKNKETDDAPIVLTGKAVKGLN